MDYSSYNHLLFERREHGVLLITMNRPEVHKPAMKRMRNHQKGSTHRGMSSTAVETTEAKAAKTRMWPTLCTMRGVTMELRSSPAK